MLLVRRVEEEGVEELEEDKMLRRPQPFWQTQVHRVLVRFLGLCTENRLHAFAWMSLWWELLYGLPCFVVTRGSRATTAAASRAGEIVIASDNESEDDSDTSDSEDSDNDDSDNDSDSSVEGYSYYGGYGRCYRCGKFLHFTEAGFELQPRYRRLEKETKSKCTVLPVSIFKAHYE